MSFWIAALTWSPNCPEPPSGHRSAGAETAGTRQDVPGSGVFAGAAVAAGAAAAGGGSIGVLSTALSPPQVAKRAKTARSETAFTYLRRAAGIRHKDLTEPVSARPDAVRDPLRPAGRARDQRRPEQHLEAG